MGTHFGIDYAAPDKAPVFNQLTLAFQAVQQGMGIGLAWTFMGDEAVEKGELQRVTTSECATGNGEFLVSVKHRKLSPLCRGFSTVDFDFSKSVLKVGPQHLRSVAGCIRSTASVGLKLVKIKFEHC